MPLPCCTSCWHACSLECHTTIEEFCWLGACRKDSASTSLSAPTEYSSEACCAESRPWSGALRIMVCFGAGGCAEAASRGAVHAGAHAGAQAAGAGQPAARGAEEGAVYSLGLALHDGCTHSRRCPDTVRVNPLGQTHVPGLDSDSDTKVLVAQSWLGLSMRQCIQAGNACLLSRMCALARGCMHCTG